MSINSRTRNVGTGSREHDFTGDDMIIRRISVCEHARKDDSEVADEAGIDGDGSPAVSAMTSFRAKKTVKPSALL